MLRFPFLNICDNLKNSVFCIQTYSLHCLFTCPRKKAYFHSVETVPLDLVALEKKQAFTLKQIKIQEEIQSSK